MSRLQSGSGAVCRGAPYRIPEGDREAKMRRVWHLVVLLVAVVIAILWLRTVAG
jgi:hypothetical protein